MKKSIFLKIAFRIRRLRDLIVYYWVKNIKIYPDKLFINSDGWSQSLSSPNDFYLDLLALYNRFLPSELRDHRSYFRTSGRGYGEDVFHLMWWMIHLEFKPQKILEIGVFRGQTLSLSSLIQRKLGVSGHVVGISPFCSAGDGVSVYAENIDYYQDTLKNFKHFNLGPPDLLKAYSTDPIAKIKIHSAKWDLIYIDGSHDYSVVAADWDSCSNALRIGGVLVLDDAGLHTNYKPASYSTAGHPGPSRVASEVTDTRFKRILQVGHNIVFLRVS